MAKQTGYRMTATWVNVQKKQRAEGEQGRVTPALNSNSFFGITGSGGTELSELKKMMRQACGNYGLYIVELDSYRRDSKIRMKAICEERMARNIGCLPSWACNSVKELEASARSFRDNLDAQRELMSGVDSDDSRYEGVVLYSGGFDSVGSYKRAIEYAENCTARPIIFVTCEKDATVSPGFNLREVQKLSCTNNKRTAQVVAKSLFIGIDPASKKRSHKCVPEFDTYLEWCKSRLKNNADAISDAGRPEITFDDVQEKPLVVCCHISDTKETNDELRWTNTLNTAAFAEYVAEMCGTDFVHYQHSL